MIKADDFTLALVNGACDSRFNPLPVFFTNEEEPRLLYLSGRQLVLERVPLSSESEDCNPNVSNCEFFQMSEAVFKSLIKHSGFRIVNFCFDGSSRRGFLNLELLDENSRRFPKMIFFDMTDKRVSKCEFLDFKADSFLHASFAVRTSGRYFVALTTRSPQSVVVYDISLQRTLGISPLSGDKTWEQALSCPQDSFMIILASSQLKHLRVIRVNDSIPNTEINLKYCLPNGVGLLEWVSDEILIITDSRSYFMCAVSHQKKSKFNVVQKLGATDFDSPELQKLQDSSISAIRRFSKGLLTATSSGIFVVYIRREEIFEAEKLLEDDWLVPVRCFSIKSCDNALCTSLEFSTNEAMLAFGFKDNSQLSLPSQNCLKMGKTDAKTKRPQMLKLFEVVVVVERDTKNRLGMRFTGSSTYYNDLIGVAEDGFGFSFLKAFSKTPKFEHRFDSRDENSRVLSCEIHPLGQFAVCGFGNRVASFYLSFNSMVPMSENNSLKNTYMLRFSERGDMLACCHLESKSNVFPIAILDAYTLRILRSVSTHSHSSRISDAIFSSLSTMLWTSSIDGALFAWTLPYLHKREILIEKEMRFLCVDYFDYSDTVVTKGENDFVIILTEDLKGAQSLISIRVQNTDKLNVMHLPTVNEFGVTLRHTSVRSFVLDDKFKGFMVGNSLGYILVYNGMPGMATLSCSIQTPCAGEISRLVLAASRTAITAFSKDGVAAIFAFCHPGESGETQYFTRGDEIARLQDREFFVMVEQDMLLRFEQKEKRLRGEMAETVNQMMFSHSQQIFETEEKNRALISSLEREVIDRQRHIDELLMVNRKLQAEASATVANIENENMQAVEELEKLYETKFASEEEKIASMEKSHRIEIKKLEEQLRQQTAAHSRELMEQHEQRKSQSDTAVNKISELQQQMEAQKRTHEAALIELQNEQDSIVAQTKQYYSAKLRKLEEEKNKLTSSILQFKNANEEAQRKEQGEKLNVEHLNECKKTLETRVAELELQLRKSASIESELRDIILKKDRAFENLLKEAEELEKVKKTLIFRTAELRKGLSPKKAQIDALKDVVSKLEQELEGMIKRQADSEGQLIKKADEIKSLAIANSKTLKRLQEREVWINNISSVIRNCVQRTDTKTWHVHMKKLYTMVNEHQQDEFSQTRSQQIKSEEGLQFDEMTSQVHHLHNKIQQLVNNGRKNSNYQRKHIESKTDENALLLNELNYLRFKYKNLNNVCTSLQIENNQYKREIKNAQVEIRKFAQISKSNGFFEEREHFELKENKDKFANAFKIKSMSRNKVSGSTALVDKIIENPDQKTAIIAKCSEEEKEELIKHLISLVNPSN